MDPHDTSDYQRTVSAEDSAAAQAVTQVLARSDGYRVRTVKSVRLHRPGDDSRLPEYIVRLSVAPRVGQ